MAFMCSPVHSVMMLVPFHLLSRLDSVASFVLSRVDEPPVLLSESPWTGNSSVKAAVNPRKRDEQQDQNWIGSLIGFLSSCSRTVATTPPMQLLLHMRDQHQRRGRCSVGMTAVPLSVHAVTVQDFLFCIVSLLLLWLGCM